MHGQHICDIMKNSWIFPAAALVVGAVGGYISGKNTSGGGDDDLTAGSGPGRTHASSRPVTVSSETTGKRTGRISSTLDISRMPGNSDRIKALLDFYSGLTPAQLQEEAYKLESLPMSERIMASFLLFGRWAEKDPQAAMAYTNKIGFAGAFVRPTVLQSWASTDPANAAKYYASNPREFAMMGMMGGRGPGGGQSGAAIIASEWARQDPTGAMAWAGSLNTEKNQAMSAVIGEIAKTDPQAASVQVAAMTAGDSKDRAIGSVVNDWARVDPQAAAEFLKQQNSAQAQQDSMRQLMPTWVSQDSSAALAYANSYEAGPVRDSALQSYVWSHNTAAPADLVKVAETITDDQKQRILSGQSGFGRRGRGGP